MRLAEFVREALGDVAFGVHAAKADAHGLVAIVPGSLNGEQVTEKTYIEFDVAVTASTESQNASGTSGKAGAGINVVGFRFGVDGELTDNSIKKDVSGLTSRIAFKVPVYLNANFRGDATSQAEAEFVHDLWGKRFRESSDDS